MLEMSDNDLNRYYCGTWLGIRTDDGIIPVRVDGVNDEGEFVFHDETSVHYQDPSLVYDYPDLGVVNCSKGVMYLSRVPERQWRKGVQPDLVAVNVLGKSSRRLSDAPRRTQEEVLRVLYNPENNTGVSRYAAKVNGTVYYKGIPVPDERVPELEYLYSYINNQDLEDIQCS